MSSNSSKQLLTNLANLNSSGTRPTRSRRSCYERRACSAGGSSPSLPASGSQFTCFTVTKATGTKVKNTELLCSGRVIALALPHQLAVGFLSGARLAGSQCPCFFWYKCTNTDAGLFQGFSLLALVVKKSTNTDARRAQFTCVAGTKVKY